ncbi:MAG: TonB-dependent receptor [Bacteroidales bacterium]
MKKYILFLFLFISSIIYAQGGMVEGVVYDEGNNDVLAYANVIVSGTTIGSTSNDNGYFYIKGIKPGYINLQVSFIGYKSKLIKDIFISNSNPYFINIYLKRDDSFLTGAVVKPKPYQKRTEAIISMQSIGKKEIESNPGSNRDISRVIQSFPGVGSTAAYRNDIIIRGGGPSENRFFLDGVEIPILNHFSTQGASGGPVGIINADFIRSVDFYSAGFPAEKYNALSGVFDFKLIDGSRDKNHYQFTIGASEAAITLEGPLSKKTNYIFSVRRSYLQFLFAAIKLPFLPTFNDYQLKLKTKIDNKNQITIISIGSLDNLRINNLDNPDISQEAIISSIPINNQWSYTIGAVYKHFFEHGFHTLVLSRNMLNNELYKYPDNDESLDKSLDYLSSEAENKFRYEYHLDKNDYKYVFSILQEYSKYDNDTKQLIFRDNNVEKLTYNSQIFTYKYGFSGQLSKSFLSKKLSTSVGIRVDGNNFNSFLKNPLNQLSPRISAVYEFGSGIKINAGWGIYYQSPSYTTLGYRENNILLNKENARYIGMNQYNIGSEKIINDNILFSIEGFYKKYFNYPININTGASLANEGADYAIYGASPVSYTGKGETFGFEILNRWNTDKFSMLASYTFVRSLFTDINENYIASSWDSKHLLTITSSYDLNNNWKIGAKWRFVGGLPYTPYDLEKSSYVRIWDSKGGAYLDYSRLNTNRFDAFHQLDIRIDKHFFFDKWTLMLYLDIQNAYNSKSQTQNTIVRDKNTDGSYKKINNGDNYILTSYPNTYGTILPTIGLMIKI